MSDNLKDILNNSNKDIDNQKLMDYLSQQLSKQDSHELEKMMADDAFTNDAVEGLEQFSNVKKIPLSVDELNRQLQKQIAKNKGRRQKRTIKEQPWVYFAIILLLLLAIISYVILKKRMDNKPPVNKPVAAQMISIKKLPN
jgi:hypothetical protein